MSHITYSAMENKKENCVSMSSGGRGMLLIHILELFSFGLLLVICHVYDAFHFCISWPTKVDPIIQEFWYACRWFLVNHRCVFSLQIVSFSFSGVKRSERDLPPMHYSLKIESFSLLLKTKVEKYESDVFEAGGHKWFVDSHHLPMTNTWFYTCKIARRLAVRKENCRRGVGRGQQRCIDDSGPYGWKGCFVKEFMC
jgi:hypothetical protein